MPIAEATSQAVVLVVDDEPLTGEYIATLLREAGYKQILMASNPHEVLSRLAAVAPDIALVDWHLKEAEGKEIVRALRERYSSEVLPIIVLTADLAPEIKLEAFRSGATEFLHKPFQATELLLRVRNLLEMRRLHQQLAEQKLQIERLLERRERELELARIEILERLARAAEYRDDLTGEHIVRVGRLSEAIGRVLGLSEEVLFLLRHAAPLHDLGKIAIPDTILRKPGKLTHEERRIMRQHTLLGAQMLEGCPYPAVQMARQIALTHHERWDGRGYPYRLKGTEIPLWGRIVALADAYDAMTHDRPYRPAKPLEEAVEEIRLQRGKQFDPIVVDAFLEPATFTAIGESGSVSAPEETAP